MQPRPRLKRRKNRSNPIRRRSTGEQTSANNSRLVVVDQGDGPYRVLYVSGRPNWEFKFLSRAIEEDEQVQLVGLIRIAKRQPKFDFRNPQDQSTQRVYSTGLTIPTRTRPSGTTNRS